MQPSQRPYYLRIVGVLFFRMPLGRVPSRPRQTPPLTAAAICVLLVLAIGLYPSPWYDAANTAAPTTTQDGFRFWGRLKNNFLIPTWMKGGCGSIRRRPENNRNKRQPSQQR